ncbi:uncharacterized protein G2W53_019328 [Senna tora]|uniref:Uncharacterized protein n=1 Tax=Senna tora TaxID=362788 RepID=A0A834U1V1_9FABA|nr:uncharacterized protein G2W53_019328 [Senna tora]
MRLLVLPAFSDDPQFCFLTPPFHSLTSFILAVTYGIHLQLQLFTLLSQFLFLILQGIQILLKIVNLCNILSCSPKFSSLSSLVSSSLALICPSTSPFWLFIMSTSDSRVLICVISGVLGTPLPAAIHSPDQFLMWDVKSAILDDEPFSLSSSCLIRADNSCSFSLNFISSSEIWFRSPELCSSSSLASAVLLVICTSISLFCVCSDSNSSSSPELCSPSSLASAVLLVICASMSLFCVCSDSNSSSRLVNCASSALILFVDSFSLSSSFFIRADSSRSFSSNFISSCEIWFRSPELCSPSSLASAVLLVICASMSLFCVCSDSNSSSRLVTCASSALILFVDSFSLSSSFFIRVDSSRSFSSNFISSSEIWFRSPELCSPSSLASAVLLVICASMSLFCVCSDSNSSSRFVTCASSSLILFVDSFSLSSSFFIRADSSRSFSSNFISSSEIWFRSPELCSPSSLASAVLLVICASMSLFCVCSDSNSSSRLVTCASNALILFEDSISYPSCI